MPHSARSLAFGNKVANPEMKEVVPHDAPKNAYENEEKAGMALHLLERLFLWIPDDESPGLLAVGLVTIRMALLSFLLALALTGLGWGVAGLPGGALIGSFGWYLHFASAPLVRELCRYSFVRRAGRPLRAATIFAITSLILHVLAWSTITGCIVNLIIELAASAAILAALSYKRFIIPVIVALVAVQATGNIAFAKREVASHKGPVSQSEPTIGGMQSWAKLYPGAIITDNKTQYLLNLTTWTVSYNSTATPAQVDSFYRSLAASEGFLPSAKIFGITMFENKDGNRFSYSVSPSPDGSKTFLQARYYQHSR